MEVAVSFEGVPQAAFPGCQVFPGRSEGEEEGRKVEGPQSSGETLATGRDIWMG